MNDGSKRWGNNVQRSLLPLDFWSSNPSVFSINISSVTIAIDYWFVWTTKHRQIIMDYPRFPMDYKNHTGFWNLKIISRKQRFIYEKTKVNVILIYAYLVEPVERKGADGVATLRGTIACGRSLFPGCGSLCSWVTRARRLRRAERAGSGGS